MIKSIFVGLFCILLINSADAQLKKNKVNTAKGIKPPKLITWLGEYRDTVSLPVNEAERIIALPLKVGDKSDAFYTISSFRLIYKKKNKFEDDETGKISTTSTAVSRLFRSTPLPELWLNTIREQLHQGEELYFFDIIAKDTQGRIMYAPGLKILVQ